ncbi:LysR family transcriptional regulator [Actinoplanes friuliensis]|uniref:LysR family transcriptional regulator n=1 Tax=Actinoplanes friuliensis DSM 7358 TaxID=1246995 RepID=U5VZT7_9ACTN|nr:LysR family transcriptional regulator [Actinoplanes friuliensis]AGZ41230.1 LysR family transcriptional regulator [Actinoplanes friuliensis DSM 7358]
MDLIGACRVFVHVGERASFTLGAAAAGVPQPVASRRVAALEKRFGERLFDRAARRAVLTTFGRDLLPAAKRLVQLADALDEDVARARLRPLTVAMPETCSVRQLALLGAAAREESTILDFRQAGPTARTELLRSGEVRVAVLAVPPDAATWVAPLGAASARDTGPAVLHIDSLRPRRSARSSRRIWIQPEDDVAHIRDTLVRLGHRAALAPAQIAVAPTLTAAVSEVVRTDDLVLCTAAQADELELYWRPLAGDPVARGYEVAAPAGGDADRLRGELASQVGRCLAARG